ncbi:MAG: hypothetical protein KME31_26865 [Tolypothrix carrinoi HA7290-LM1]|nr:hypothetical protein [Tolypothrix carrinoi HA7290-LM1]
MAITYSVREKYTSNGGRGQGAGGTRGASALRGFPALKHLAWTRRQGEPVRCAGFPR